MSVRGDGPAADDHGHICEAAGAVQLLHAPHERSLPCTCRIPKGVEGRVINVFAVYIAVVAVNSMCQMLDRETAMMHFMDPILTAACLWCARGETWCTGLCQSRRLMSSSRITGVHGVCSDPC